MTPPELSDSRPPEAQGGDYRTLYPPSNSRSQWRRPFRRDDRVRRHDGGALWQDLKFGVEHIRAWKRIALVTDIEWMHH